VSEPILARALLYWKNIDKDTGYKIEQTVQGLDPQPPHDHRQEETWMQFDSKISVLASSWLSSPRRPCSSRSTLDEVATAKRA
jgi:hypothetical protein